MVSKKLITDYDFKTIQDYFDYIIESHINGNFSQCLKLHKKLSLKQKKDFFLTHAYDGLFPNDPVSEVLEYINQENGFF